MKTERDVTIEWLTKHHEFVLELLGQPQPGMPTLPTAWREVFWRNAFAAINRCDRQELTTPVKPRP